MNKFVNYHGVNITPEEALAFPDCFSVTGVNEATIDHDCLLTGIENIALAFSEAIMSTNELEAYLSAIEPPISIYALTCESFNFEQFNDADGQYACVDNLEWQYTTPNGTKSFSMCGFYTLPTTTWDGVTISQGQAADWAARASNVAAQGVLAAATLAYPSIIPSSVLEEMYRNLFGAHMASYYNCSATVIECQNTSPCIGSMTEASYAIGIFGAFNDFWDGGCD